jgi:hypothetical protein
LLEGLEDAALRFTVTHDWHDWRAEIGWMSLYFSIAVWISIAFLNAPRWQQSQADAASSSPQSSQLLRAAGRSAQRHRAPSTPGV